MTKIPYIFEKTVDPFERIGLEADRNYRQAWVLSRTEHGVRFMPIIRTTAKYVVFRDDETGRERRVMPHKVEKVKANVGGELVYFG